MTIEEGKDFFANHPKVSRALNTLFDVGLGYMKLGQPATTLSGGEAQRLKLSRELSKRPKGNCLYILDEPTTGLHFNDIRILLKAINKLIDHGHSVIVIEHNLDVIKTADFIVDLGPEGGDMGGHIVAQGTPKDVSLNKNSLTGQFLSSLIP
jgi:excinuclease ABC subunit A